MEISIAVILLGGLIFFSHASMSMFEKTKIPNVLLLILIGIIVGPIANWVTLDDFGQIGKIFTTITLVVILFESGTSLKFREIGKAIGPSFLITFINFLISLAIATIVISIFTPLNMVQALFVGAIIGGTSSAVVIPMIKQLKLGQKSETILSLESALSDVLCLIVGLTILGGMRAGVKLEISDILMNMLENFLIALGIGIISGFAWSALLRIFRTLKNSMFTSLAAVFIVYGLVEYIGYNGGIAALAFGIMLGNSGIINESKLFKKIFSFNTVSLSQNEKDFFSEIVFILQTYFFVFIGISIQFGNVWYYILGLIIVAGIILSRPLSIRILSRKKHETKDLAIMSIMTPKGLVPAVLATIPLQEGIVSKDIGYAIQDIGFSIVLFSIIICSILVIFVSKDPLFMTKLFQKKKELTEEGETGEETNEDINTVEEKQGIIEENTGDSETTEESAAQSPEEPDNEIENTKTDEV